MDAATSTLNHPFNVGPNPPQTQGPSSTTQGPSRTTQGPSSTTQGPTAAPFSEEQQHHHKPFFYVQPSQPFVPMQSVQWPLPLAVPLSYGPYYGYPGFGYGMPLMPHYQPSPYLETPGFVVPHTHLHLMDYRRMLNPQYYQSMAYHARRLRYQHNVPSRGVTSSEVQTEPLPTASQRTSTPGSDAPETSNETSSLSAALSVQKDERSLELKDLVPLSTNPTPPKGSFVIETEEVRIECCRTPAGLQVLHSRETAEMSHSFSQDVVQCSSIVQSGLLSDDNLKLLNADNKTEQSRQPCPDILLVETPSSSDKIPALETNPVSSTGKLRSKMAADVEGIVNEKDLKVVHLPFDAKYLEELRKMESTVWSMEETMVPSPEFLFESRDGTLPGEVPSAETLIFREETLQEEVVPMIEMPLRIEDELQDVVPNVELPVDELASEDVPQEPRQPVIKTQMLTNNSRSLLLSDDSPLDGNIQDHQDTSFESLPAYLPSTSWLVDFENVRYPMMPPAPQKQSKAMSNRSLDVPTRRRKLDVEFKESSVRKPKERYKPKGRVDRRSLSDHECCMSRSYNENAFIPYGLKGQRLCTRCSTKQRVYNTSPEIDNRQVLKRKVGPFQPWNDVILPTCEACKGHVKKRFTRQGSGPDVRFETEGESSENGSCRKWRQTTDDPREKPKRPLTSKQNVEKCQTAVYSKLREKNCFCNELQHHQTQWQRIYHCPHGNAIREMDENCAAPIQDKWRNVDQMYLAHRWQTEKSWKAVKPGHNVEGFKNDLRAQHLNKHKKPQPQSQGVQRKDTRC